jgi:D-glycero-D-manno-heptose 1,7-bisphosphate phosphatase
MPGFPMPDLRPAVLFDRDGVLNIDAGYTHKVEDLTWTPGAQRAIKRLNEAGVLVMVVTNQSGVARGYYDEAAVEAFHTAMQAQLALLGAHFDAVYACPYNATGVVERFVHPDHPDRKPNPGMLLRAMAEHGADPTRTVMIGDRGSDLEAAKRAGVEGVRYHHGTDLDALIERLLPKLIAPKA